MPGTQMINEGFSFQVAFDNTATGSDVGYAPYIDMSAPDSIDIGSATYLGSPVSLIPVGQYDGAGNLAANHPLLGTPVASGTPFNFLYVIQLPFGSFVAAQPVATIDIAATLNSADGAVVGTPISASVRGGFALGADALDNPGTDPPILGAANAATITPTVIDLVKSALIAEDERATGPNFPFVYQLTINVANGETVTAVDLRDALPNSLVYLNDVAVVGGTGLVITDQPVPGAPRNAPDNNFLIEFASITGTASDQDVIVTYSVYIDRTNANGQPVLNANSGDDVTATNNASVTATYGAGTVGDDSPDTDETITQKSLAIQKGYAVVADTGGAGPTPGDTIEYTMNIQVSDYFSFGNLVVDDTFSDGQLFDVGFAPTFSIFENGVTTSGTFGPANYLVTHNSPGDGSTDVHFDVFEVVPDGVLDGDLFAELLTTSGTTVTVRYRTVIQESFTDTYPSGDASVDVGDVLSNDVTTTGQLPSGQFEADDSGTSFDIVGPTITKSVYAIDGDTGRASDRLSAGHTITYRLTMDLASTDIENLVITDYLPLPVLESLEVTTFDNSGPSATAPAAGTASYGPLHTLHTVVPSTDPPSIATDVNANSVSFDIGTFDRTPSSSATIDILFTVTAQDRLMADGLFLTNQVLATYGTTNAGTSNQAAIAPTVISAPTLSISKGVVSTSSAAGVFTPATVGPVAFAAPQAGGPSFAGGITSSTLSSAPIDSDLSGVDAGDFVKFALVIHNTGSADAFDVNIVDTLPARFQIPATVPGMKLEVRDGDGNTLSYANAAGGPAIPADLFGAGIRLVDPSASNGALKNFDVASLGGNGTNIAVITYDLQLTAAAQPFEAILNTAAIDQYSAADGGNDHTLGSSRSDWMDDASVTTANFVATKSIDTTSESFTGFVSGAERLAIGEIVRYRLVTQMPEGSSRNFQLQDRLPNGLQFLDDNTAMVAFVGNGASLSSTDTGGSLNLQVSGAGLNVVGNAANLASISPTFVLPDANVGATSSTDTDVDTNGDGTDVFFKLGDIVNADSDADAEFVVIEFNAFVLNSAAASNDQNDVRQNDFQTRITRDDASVATTTSTAINVIVAEPLVSLSKSAIPAIGDAGDTISFSVTFANSNTATRASAFDARLLDSLPARYALNLGSITITPSGGAAGITNSSAGNSLDITVATLPLGASVTVAYTAQMLTTVEAGSTVTNTAQLTYSSLPGPSGTVVNPTGSVTPGASGTDTGERNGSDGVGGAVDDYAATASQSVTVRSPTLSKQLVGTEIINAHNASNQAVIGELVTYRLTIGFPEGTTSAATVVDTLDAGLAFVGMDLTSPVVTSAGVSISGSTNPTVAPGGQTVTWNLGTVTNTDNNNATNESIVLTYQAIVLNVAGNQGEAPATALNNSAVFSSTSASVGPVSAANVTVIEPAVMIGLSVGLDTDGDTFYDDGTSGDAGDGIEYTITLTNGSGVDAFDVEFSFPLPIGGPGFSLVTTNSSNFSVMDNATSGALTAANFELVGSDAAGWTLRRVAASNIDMLASQVDGGGQPRAITLRVWGNIVQSVTPLQVIPAQGSTQWTSYDGTPPRLSPYTTADEERDGSNAADNRHNYVDTDSASFTIKSAAISKLLFSTSDASTSGTNVTIGETVTYALKVTLPEGTIPSTTVVDNIPNGLAYTGFLGTDATGVTVITTAAASAGLLSSDFGGSITGTGPNVSSPGTNGADARYVFGNIDVANDNDDTNNSFLILVRTQVLDVVSNDGLLPGLTTLTNNATLDTLSDGIGILTSNDLTTTVTEPQLQITKTASAAMADAGDVVTYTLTIQHTSASSAAAQDLTIRDLITDTDLLLVAGSVDASLGSVPGTVVTGNMVSPDDTTLVVTIPTLSVGQNVVITYQATVQQSARPADVISNSAQVDWDSLLGAGNLGRTGSDSDGSNFSVARPTIHKTILSTGINSPANDDSQITIGEYVLYEIEVTIPEGTTPDAQIVDSLDPGLQYFQFSSLTGSAALGSSQGAFANSALFDPSLVGTIAGDGSAANPYVITFHLGDLTNSDTDNLLAETIRLRYLATAMNTADNRSHGASPGDLKHNSATFTWDLGGPMRETTAAAAAPSVEIVEPDVQIGKTLTSGSSVDAGDAVTWTITIQHTASSDADAYDVTFQDPLPPTIDFVSLLATHSTLGDTSPTFEYDSATHQVRTVAGQSFDLAWGESLTLTLQGAVNIAAEPAQLITNQASAQWTSLNASAFDGDELSERNGTGGSLNNYLASTANSTLQVKSPVSSKLLLGSAITSANNTAFDVAIGETLQYRLTLTVPEGTTRLANWVDSLDPGLQFVQVDSVTFSSGLTSSQATFTPTIVVDGVTSAQTLTFDLGTLTNANTNDGIAESVSIDYTVRTANMIINQGLNSPAAASSLQNSAVFNWTVNSTAQALPAVQATPVTVIEPELQVTKSVDDTTPRLGATITYTVHISHDANSSADAYDLEFRDLLPGDVTLNIGSIAAVGANLIANASAGNALMITLDALSLGNMATVTYTALVTGNFADVGASINNTVRLEWTSLPGAVASERSGAGGALNDYFAVDSASAVITQPVLHVAKQHQGAVANATDPLNWDVPMRILVSNDGNVDLFNLSLADDLQAQFGSAFVSVTPPSAVDASGLIFGGTAPGLDPTWDGNRLGSGNVDIFDGSTGLLHPGEWIAVTFVVTVNPDAVGVMFPLTNQALGQADFIDDSLTQTISDLSDSGTDPSGTNPGQPGDTGGVDDPTPLYLADIAVTKTVVGVPIRLPNHNFSVTYEVALKNTGTVDLRNPQIREDLMIEFGSAEFVSVLAAPTLVSGPSQPGSLAPMFAAPVWNGNLGGSGRVDFFDGSSGLLLPGDAILIHFTVEVDPDATGTSHPLDNQVVAVATPLDNLGNPLPGGTITDLSDSGTDPSSTNPSAPGDLGTADDPTPLEIGDIGVAKQVNQVTEALSGIYDVQYAVVLENTGTVPLSPIQVSEDLLAEFGSAFVGLQANASIVSSSLSPGASLPNLASPVWDANLASSGHINFFDGATGLLHPGDWLIVTFTARVNTNSGDTTPPSDYTNQIDAQGVTATGLTVIDVSDDGTNANTNNGTGGADDPSPFTVPMVRVTKSFGSTTAHADGTYTVPIQILVENSGTTPLTDLTLQEDISAEFREALVSISSPQLTGFGTYTGVLPLLNPLWLSNTSLDVIQPTQLNETLAVGEAFVFNFDVTVDPDRLDDASQLMFNQALATGRGLNFDGNLLTVTDESGADTAFDMSGVDNDQPSQLQIPELRVAKSVASVVPAGLDYVVTFTITVENTGSSPLTGWNVRDDLSAALGPAFAGVNQVLLDTTGVGAGVAPTLNFGPTASATAYDGGLTAGGTELLNGDGMLLPAEYFTIALSFTLDPEMASSNDFFNQALATAHDPSSNPISDWSDSGTNPNTSNPGAANDTGGHDDPTPIDIAEIAVVKRVVGVSPIVMNGHYAAVVEIIVQNAGTVDLSNVRIREDLEAELGSQVFVAVLSPAVWIAGPYEANSVAPSFDAAWDGGLGASGNVELFVPSGSTRLVPGDSLTLQFTVEIDPDASGTSSLLFNQVTAYGDGMGTGGGSLGTVTDLSDSGSNPSSTNAGAPGDRGTADDPTPIEIPSIRVAKQVNLAVPTGITGQFDVQYVLVLENAGSVPLNHLQLTEDFSAEFGGGFVAIQGSPAFTGSSLSAGASLPNFDVSWDGTTAHATLWDGSSGYLQPGDWFSLTFTVRLDAVTGDTTVPMDFTNQVLASGDGVTFGGPMTVSDLSDDGLNPNTNNGTGGTDDRTGLKSPQVRVGKTVGTVTANADGSYTVPVWIQVVNTGTADITDLSLIEDLRLEFGDAFIGLANPQITPTGVYNGVLPQLNPGWNSANTAVDVIDPAQANESLLVGESFLFSVDVIVDPDAVDGASQYLFNQANVTGQSTNFDGSAITVTDQSGSPTPSDVFGNDLDNPFQLLIPEIRATKHVVNAVPVANLWHVTLELRVENTGSTDLSGIQVADDLVTQWGIAFSGVLNVSLDATAVGLGTAPTLNFGATAGSQPFNGGLTGAASANLLNGDGLLNPGEFVIVLMTIAIDPDASGSSVPLNNQAQATASGPTSTVSDLSDDGNDPNSDNPTAAGDSGTGSHDDPTPILIGDIAVTKEVVGSPTRLPDGNFYVTYRVALENTGTVDLANLQLAEDLVSQFGSGVLVAIVSSPALVSGPVNPGSLAPGLATWDGGLAGNTNLFDGTSGRLVPGDGLTMEFTVEVDPDVSGSATTFFNQVQVTADAVTGTVTDASDAGNDPNTSNPLAAGDLGTYDDPTPLRLPGINLAKQLVAGPTSLGTGSSLFSVTYEVRFMNTGNATVTGLDLFDNLASQFGGAFVAVTSAPAITGHTLTDPSNLPTINPAWIGDTSLSMFQDNGSLGSGESITLRYSIDVDSLQVNGMTLLNQAMAAADDLAGLENGLTDLSDDGPDPRGINAGSPGDTGGYDDPTPTVLPNSVVGVAKLATWDDVNDRVTFDFFLEHLGVVEARQLSMLEDLDALFGAGNYTVSTPQRISGPTTITVNVAYNGASDAELIGVGSTMQPGESAHLRILVNVLRIEDVQGNGLGFYQNQVTMITRNSLGNTYTDLSHSGMDPDPDGDGDPTNNNVPTNGRLTPDATVGVAKSGVVASDSDSITYTFTFENFGNTRALNLSAPESIASVFGAGNFTVASIARTAGPATFAANGMYNGDTDAELIAAGSSLLPGQTATIAIVVRVPSVAAGSYLNSVSVTSLDSDGGSYTDASQDGMDPDPDGNNSPLDNTQPTVVTLHRGFVSGTVFVDYNHNGRQDAMEPGIPHVTIRLTGTPMGMPVTYETQTDTNGAYSFRSLWPGNYTLVEVHPVNFVDGQDVAGNLGGTATNDQIQFALPALDSVATGYNFAELGLNPLVIGKGPFLGSSLGPATPPAPLPEAEQLFRLFTVVDRELKICPVEGDDQITLNLATEPITLTHNFVRYAFSGADISRISLDAGPDTDTVSLIASGLADQLTADQQRIRLTSARYIVELRQVEHLVYDSGGGDDHTTLVDSPGNDQFVADARQSMLLRSDGSTVTVAADTNFVRVQSIGGSEDQAILQGTADADTFSSLPAEQTAIRSRGSHHQVVVGFEYVDAFSNDSADRAILYDTPAEDIIEGRLEVSLLTGNGYRHRAFGYAATIFVSSAVGDDMAVLYGGADAETLIARPDASQLTRGNLAVRAQGFRRVQVHSGGGADNAYLFGSAGDDQAVLTPTSTLLRGNNFEYTAIGFVHTGVFAEGGAGDAARFEDSPADDLLMAGPRASILSGPGYITQAFSFGTVDVFATAGGRDTAIMYDSSGDDEFLAEATTATMRGVGFDNRAHHFETVYGQSVSGGDDTARLFDSAGNDLVTNYSPVTSIRAADGNRTVHVSAFDHVDVTFSAGGQDELMIDDVYVGELLYGRGQSVEVTGRRSFAARGFDSLLGVAHPGHTPRWDVQNVDYLFSRRGVWV